VPVHSATGNVRNKLFLIGFFESGDVVTDGRISLIPRLAGGEHEGLKGLFGLLRKCPLLPRASPGREYGCQKGVYSFERACKKREGKWRVLPGKRRRREERSVRLFAFWEKGVRHRIGRKISLILTDSYYLSMKARSPSWDTLQLRRDLREGLMMMAMMMKLIR